MRGRSSNYEDSHHFLNVYFQVTFPLLSLLLKLPNNECKSRDNKSVNNYGCLLKRMLYCPGSGQELLPALGVTLVCRASNVFLVLKVPLSIIFTKVSSYNHFNQSISRYLLMVYSMSFI